MPKRILLPLALCGMVNLVSAQTPQIKFTRYTLPNGLKVILHRDPSAPVVAVSVMYHVGSKNEQTTRTGFAHFFEHLLFEGSPNIGRGEYMKTIKNAGGQLNANTTADRTFYYEVLPSNQLELALYMESERMLHAKIDQKGVETQREVVKEEKRMRYDNQPYGSVLPEMMKRSFNAHPYRWTTIGEMDHLNAATLDEFMKFYKDFYVPENAILSIAGDIDEAKTKQLIGRYFAEVPKGGKAIYRPSITEPAQKAEVRDTVLDNIQLPAVVQGYHTPAQTSQDAYALRLLTSYLTDGGSSLLTREVKDKQQKAVQVAAFPLPYEDPGLFLIFALANQGVDPKDLEKSIDEQIAKVQKDGISDHDLQKVMNQTETGFVGRLGSARSLAELLAQYEMYFGDANLVNTDIERYRKVTRDDVKRVANQYLTPQNRTVLYYLPKAESKS